MTIQEKNVEIAKMLGWDFVKPSDTKIGAWAIPTKKEREWILKIKDKTYSKIHNTLLFHSDANWQFEALDYLKQLGYRFMMADNLIVIQCPVVKKLSKTAVKLECSELSRKDAIFEALFQFSQYLKEKK